MNPHKQEDEDWEDQHGLFPINVALRARFEGEDTLDYWWLNHWITTAAQE